MNLWEMLKASKGLPSDDYMARLFALKTGRNSAEDVIVSGVPCVLENSVGKPLINYRIYGNTVQNGTPTPETPVEVQNVGELITDGENSGKYEIPVVCRGKNLFDYRAMFEKSTEGVNEYFRAFRVKLKPNTLYTISTNISEYNAYTAPFIVTNTSETVATVTGGVSSTRPRTVSTANDGILVVSYRIKETNPTVVSGTVVTIDKFTDYNAWLQIESGDTATEYEPYQVPKTTDIFLSQPIYQNEYVLKNREKSVCCRGYGVKVFNGTEQWSNVYGVNLFTIQNYLNSTPFSTGYGLCTHYVYNPIQSDINPSTQHGEFVLQKFKTSYNIFIKDTRFNTTDDFKAFLTEQYANGTPVTIYYPLANPITTPITLPEIPTFSGNATIETDTEIQPSDMEITYKSRRKKQ